MKLGPLIRGRRSERIRVRSTDQPHLVEVSIAKMRAHQLRPSAECNVVADATLSRTAARALRDQLTAWLNDKPFQVCKCDCPACGYCEDSP